MSDKTIGCIGKMTYANCGGLQTKARQLMPETKRMVLDFAQTTHLDSFGLGVLVSLYLSAQRQHCHLLLINMNQRGQQLLRVTDLTYLLDSHRIQPRVQRDDE
jgi:anti-anti-sigma factor